MRGRKPKPDFLKLISGTDKPSRMNPDAPQPEGDLSTAPEWFDAEQRATWDKAIADAPPGLLKNLDASVFIMWAVAATLHRQASIKVASTGMMVRAPRNGYPMQNPYLTVVNKQAQIMLRACAEMGFTPSSRSRVKVTKGAKGADPFGDLPEVHKV